METPVTPRFSEQVHDLKKEAGPKGIGPQVSDLAHAKNDAKKALNASILESTINVSATNSPQSLVLKAALEGINDALKETMGDNAIQNAYDSGLDVSPQATADRIVSLSTAFFDKYQEHNPTKSMTDFIEVIRGGIDKGFSEARDILSGLQVLEGDIAANIDSTYDLVQAGLKAFIDSFANPEDNKEQELLNPS